MWGDVYGFCVVECTQDAQARAPEGRERRVRMGPGDGTQIEAAALVDRLLYDQIDALDGLRRVLKETRDWESVGGCPTCVTGSSLGGQAYDSSHHTGGVSVGWGASVSLSVSPPVTARGGSARRLGNGSWVRVTLRSDTARGVTVSDGDIHVVATPQSVVDKPPHLLDIQASCQCEVSIRYAVAPQLQVPFVQRAAIRHAAIGAIL